MWRGMTLHPLLRRTESARIDTATHEWTRWIRRKAVLPAAMPARILGVEMDRVRVHREAGEPDVVGGDDGTAERVLVDVADLEVLEHAPGPPFLRRHQITCSFRHAEIVAASKPSSSTSVPP